MCKKTIYLQGRLHLPGRKCPQQVESAGIFVAHVVDGKIVEGWHCPDYLTLLQQLDAFPGR